MSTTTYDPVEQRMTSLAKANATRATLADLRAAISNDPNPRIAAANALNDPNAGALTLRRLLLSVPRFGHSRMADYIAEIGVVTADMRVRDLSTAQRTMLADKLQRTVPHSRRPSAFTHCQYCGEALLSPRRAGLCGFCIEEGLS